MALFFSRYPEVEYSSIMPSEKALWSFLGHPLGMLSMPPLHVCRARGKAPPTLPPPHPLPPPHTLPPHTTPALSLACAQPDSVKAADTGIYTADTVRRYVHRARIVWAGMFSFPVDRVRYTSRAHELFDQSDARLPALDSASSVQPLPQAEALIKSGTGFVEIMKVGQEVFERACSLRLGGARPPTGYPVQGPIFLVAPPSEKAACIISCPQQQQRPIETTPERPIVAKQPCAENETMDRPADSPTPATQWLTDRHVALTGPLAQPTDPQSEASWIDVADLAFGGKEYRLAAFAVSQLAKRGGPFFMAALMAPLASAQTMTASRQAQRWPAVKHGIRAQTSAGALELVVLEQPDATMSIISAKLNGSFLNDTPIDLDLSQFPTFTPPKPEPTPAADAWERPSKDDFGTQLACTSLAAYTQCFGETWEKGGHEVGSTAPCIGKAEFDSLPVNHRGVALTKSARSNSGYLHVQAQVTAGVRSCYFELSKSRCDKKWGGALKYRSQRRYNVIVCAVELALYLNQPQQLTRLEWEASEPYKMVIELTSQMDVSP